MEMQQEFEVGDGMGIAEMDMKDVFSQSSTTRVSASLLGAP
jgi:hypothetical protein